MIAASSPEADMLPFDGSDAMAPPACYGRDGQRLRRPDPVIQNIISNLPNLRMTRFHRAERGCGNSPLCPTSGRKDRSGSVNEPTVTCRIHESCDAVHCVPGFSKGKRFHATPCLYETDRNSSIRYAAPPGRCTCRAAVCSHVDGRGHPRQPGAMPVAWSAARDRAGPERMEEEGSGNLACGNARIGQRHRIVGDLPEGRRTGMEKD